MSKVINIIVAPDGTSRVETEGFSGSECREASRFLEQALGRKNGETFTTEYYEAEQHQQNQQKEGG